ncbi:MAG: VOC family protein [Actinomycetes bacterium]
MPGTDERLPPPPEMVRTSEVVRANVAAVIVDCLDPERLALFWCDLLGLHVTRRLGDPADYVDCSAIGGSVYLGFQRVRSTREKESRLHLDVEPIDIDAVTRWIEDNGGSRAPGGDVFDHDERWRVMLDPEGNQFCLWFPDES